MSDLNRVCVKETDESYINRPNVDGCRFFINGEIRSWSGAVQIVESPIYLEGSDQKIVIGRQARMSPKEALEALDAAVQSWDHGKGEWASMDFQVDFHSASRTATDQPD